MVYRDGKPAFEEISQNTITVKMLNWSQQDGSTRADHKISENEIFKSHLPPWRIGWQVATEVVPESLHWFSSILGESYHLPATLGAIAWLV